LAIIRCLLDYADAEFTQDTAESNPRARRLYLTALELLEATELKQSLNQCEEIIGILDDIPISDGRWQINIQQIKGDLKAIPDPQRLQPIVNQIRQALSADTPLEQRFVEARGMLNQAIAADRAQDLCVGNRQHQTKCRKSKGFFLHNVSWFYILLQE